MFLVTKVGVRLVLLSLLICMVACTNRNTPAAGVAASDAEKNAVVQTMHDWAQGYLTRDRAILDRVRADDWVYSGDPSGAVVTKQEADKMFLGDTSTRYTAFDYADLNVRVYGTSAVVNARENMRWETDGKPDSASYRVTATFVKQDGQWRCVASHSSPVAAK